jgi:SAM-dependent methyltransferase
VCGGSDRELWLSGLTDRIFRAAAGRWTLWRCSACAAAWLDPRPTAATIARAYAVYYTHAEGAKNFLLPGERPDLALKRALHLSHYNRSYGHALPGAVPWGWVLFGASRWRRARAGQFIRHLPAPRSGPAVLVDVGCGDGSFLPVARWLGYDAVGIEFDPQAAARAQARGYRVHVGGIEDAPIAPGSVDQITLSHVIEHLHAPVHALAEMRRWLRPGGRIWVQTPNIEGHGAGEYGADWRGLEPPRHLVLFHPQALRAALQRAGYDRPQLQAPQLDAQFYIGQSRAIRAGVDPYAIGRDARRRARREGQRWDRAALADPNRAESVTMVAYRSGAD